MKLIFTLLACLCVFGAYGQYSLRPNLYFQNQNVHYYNPSAGLNNDSLEHYAALYGKYSIVDSEVWEKPPVVFANYMQRLKNKKGFYSVGFIRDSYSFFNRQSLYAGYIHQLTVFKKRTLSFGLRGVFNLDRINWNEFPAAARTGRDSRFSPDLDLGIHYQGRKFTLGLGAKNLLATETNYEGETLIKNHPELMLNLSYAMYFSNNFVLAPMAALYTERKTDLDLGAHLSLYRRVHFTYLFRVRQLRSIYGVELDLIRGLRIGFAADRSIIYNDNNLDLVIGYAF